MLTTVVTLTCSVTRYIRLQTLYPPLVPTRTGTGRCGRQREFQVYKLSVILVIAAVLAATIRAVIK